MEEKDVMNGSGHTIKGDEAPRSLPSSENPDPSGGSTAPPTSAAPVNVTAAPPPSMAVKKKRGRPRKYAADGSIVALSPMPISASIPLAGDYSTWKHSLGSSKKKHKLDLENPGGTMPYSGGAGFIPHVITVNPGEDVTNKIISFSQQGTRAICILAANGTISNVTLRQVNSSGGTTLTYEGRFEIISLTGSFMPSDNGLTKSRTGGMSVSLAGQDCRVIGGGLAGMLVAAGPVQVVIGSFLLSHHQMEQKPKKPKYEQTISFASSVAANPISVSPPANISQKISLTTSTFFNNLASTNSVQRSNNKDHENNVSLANEDSERPNS